MTNQSHTTHLARLLAARLGVSHAQAVERIRRARLAGLLPRVLDDDGLLVALETLRRETTTIPARSVDVSEFRLRFGRDRTGEDVTLGTDDLGHGVGLLGDRRDMEPLARDLVAQLLRAGWTGAVITDPNSPVADLDLVPVTSLSGSLAMTCWGVHLGAAVASSIDSDDDFWYASMHNVTSMAAWALGRPDETPSWSLGELAALLSDDGFAAGHVPDRPGAAPLGVQPGRTLEISDVDIAAAHGVGVHLARVLEASPALATTGPRGLDLHRPVLVAHRDLGSGAGGLLASFVSFGVIARATRPAFVLLDAGASPRLVHEVLAGARGSEVVVIVVGHYAEREHLTVQVGHAVATDYYLTVANSGLFVPLLLDAT